MIEPEGSLELILGTMFSGKSTKLILRLKEIEHRTHYNFLLFKPTIDARYGTKSQIQTHDQLGMDCVMINNSSELSKYLHSKEKEINKKIKVIGIDEIQFLDGKILDYCKKWIKNEERIVIASGLLYDFRNKFFKFKNSRKTMIDLLNLVPDKVDYGVASCQYEEENGLLCKKPAPMTRYCHLCE
ncbi:MAG: hypothetical protein ABIC91_06960 [Nanoarchaeota archaeon]